MVKGIGEHYTDLLERVINLTYDVRRLEIILSKAVFPENLHFEEIDAYALELTKKKFPGIDFSRKEIEDEISKD